MGMFGGPSVFPGGVGQFVGGYSGNFVGGLNPAQKAAQDASLQREAERQAEQRDYYLKRRLMKQDAQTTDRELSLKEMLANHQMGQDQAATGLARDRLGLDSNIASNDANARSNAMSLQERLGWAGENRMSNADQMANDRAGNQLSLQERLGLMSEGRLSKSADQDEAYRRAALGQTAELAREAQFMPSARDVMQNKQAENALASGEKMTRYTHDNATGTANLNARLQQYLNQTPSAESVMRDQRTGQEIGQRGRIAKMENDTRRDVARYPWDLGMTPSEQAANNLSQSKFYLDKDRFRSEKDAEQFRRTKQTLNEQLQNEFRDRQQDFDENGVPERVVYDASKRAKMQEDTLKAEDAWRKRSDDTARFGIKADIVGKSGMQMTPDEGEGLWNSIKGELGMKYTPIADPQERENRRMLDLTANNARIRVLGSDRQPADPDEQEKVNKAIAEDYDKAKAKGWYGGTAIEGAAQRHGAKQGTQKATLMDQLKQAEADRFNPPDVFGEKPEHQPQANPFDIGNWNQNGVTQRSQTLYEQLMDSLNRNMRYGFR